MEFLPGGDLLLKLKKSKRPLEERVLRRIVKDVCSGVAFLHRESFVHGDLKSANVLFDANGTAKVGWGHGAKGKTEGVPVLLLSVAGRKKGGEID